MITKCVYFAYASCVLNNLLLLSLAQLLQLVSRQEDEIAWKTTKDVLRNLLGENIPIDGTFDPSDCSFQHRLNEARRKLLEMSENDLVTLNEMTNPNHLQLMRFYHQLAFISYFVRQDMIKWFTGRLVELTLEHGVCKYSAAALVRFAMTLDTKEGYRIGKIAISLLQRFDAIDQLPSIFLSFYGYIAIYVEPLQVSSRRFIFLLLLCHLFNRPLTTFQLFPFLILLKSCLEM